MFKQSLRAMVLLAGVFFVGFSHAADEPTLQQVYQAAESGRIGDAQTMMAKVLQDHPNSSKAHFVEAELLAKQGQLGSANTELQTAERLSPGLAFAKPEAVRTLKQRIAGTLITQPSANYYGHGSNRSAGLPWGLIALGVGVLVAIVYFARALSRRNIAPVYATGTGMPGTGPVTQPYGGIPPAGGGMGSTILGGLATGAAVGAGVVAGEALAHRLMDGGHVTDLQQQRDDFYAPSGDDLGGNDFGIDSGSSWDDDAGGGGDWN